MKQVWSNQYTLLRWVNQYFGSEIVALASGSYHDFVFWLFLEVSCRPLSRFVFDFLIWVEF